MARSLRPGARKVNSFGSASGKGCAASRRPAHGCVLALPVVVGHQGDLLSIGQEILVHCPGRRCSQVSQALILVVVFLSLMVVFFPFLMARFSFCFSIFLAFLMR